MANMRWSLLALGMLIVLAKVESPPWQYSCGDGEYDYSGICCKNCPAGTHVDEPCSVPHTSGLCVACTAGDYTAHENALDKCRPCDECKPGTTMVKACTVKSNTECRCADGYYCPGTCEECLICKTRCPEGQIIVQKCNATVDMECGPAHTGSWYLQILYIAIPLMVAAIGIAVFQSCKKCRQKENDVKKKKLISVSTDHLLPSWKNSNTDAPPTESPEVQPCLADPASVSSYSDLPESINVPLSSTKEASSSGAVPPLHLTDKPVTHNVQSNVLPSNIGRSAVIKPSDEELNEIFGELTNKMRVCDGMTLMRIAGLSDYDRDIIIYDYPSDAREQMHRMLKTLCDRFGTEKAFCKLLNGLRQMELTLIYENLQNELLSKSIRIEEDKGKCIYFVKTAQNL